jgi:hypothetical protein
MFLLLIFSFVLHHHDQWTTTLHLHRERWSSWLHQRQRYGCGIAIMQSWLLPRHRAWRQRALVILCQTECAGWLHLHPIVIVIGRSLSIICFRKVSPYLRESVGGCRNLPTYIHLNILGWLTMEGTIVNRDVPGHKLQLFIFISFSSKDDWLIGGLTFLLDSWLTIRPF